MAPPIPRIPPNYGQTRNPEERGMWEETTDQYLLRIEQLTPVERGIWYPNGEYLEPGMISQNPQWEETTDQYLLRIESEAKSIGQITLADLSTADKVAIFGGGALVILAIVGRDFFRNGKH